MPSKPLRKKKKTAVKRVVKNTAQASAFPTAIGQMAVAWRGEKIVAVFLPEESEKKLLAQVRKRLRAPKLTFSAELPVFAGHMAAQIRSHLRGEPQKYDFAHVQLPARGPFTTKVYECSMGIPSGTVLTYRELAAKAGSPKAFRAVGQAMATNPLPIVIPCHRVVGTSKSAGGFSAHGGLATKARILDIESPDSKQD
ncbi:MAG: methylated-DNA--[protein]-cysteine S-methyltransferase [Bdellovibrionota bacterium]